MFYAGLDLSRKRLDVCVVDRDGAVVAETAVAPDADGLVGLAARLVPLGGVHAAIESMTGARFVHDRLEELGWEVEIADAQKVKGLAPLACKTDRIDAWVLAELGRRELVPAIWLPDPRVRAERERACWRLHLVRHRVALKNRVHSTLMAFGKPCPVSDLFGERGRELLERLEVPDPWRSDVLAAVALIDELDHEITEVERELHRLGADHPYVPVDDGSWDRLGARLHDRRRDRLDRALSLAEETLRLHRPLPARLPVGRARQARLAGQGPRRLETAAKEKVSPQPLRPEPLVHLCRSYALRVRRSVRKPTCRAGSCERG